MINTLRKYYSKITPNLFWSFASKGVAAIAFILIDILLARVLEAELYGKWQQFFSLLTILLYITYSGVPTATQAFATQNLDKPELKNVLSNSLVLQILFSGIITGIILLMRNQIAGIVNQPEFASILIIAAPYLFIGALEEYLKNVFIGIKRTQYHFYMNVMSFGLRLVILVFITLFFIDIPSIIYGYSAAMLASGITGLVLYKKYYKEIIETSRPMPRYYKKIFLYSLPVAVSIFLGLSIPEINIQMLGMLSTSTEVAYLSVGKQLTSKLPQIAVAVAMGIMPDFAKITPNNKQQKKKRFFRIIKLNLILFGFISGGIILFSPTLIPIIYGESYLKAVLPLQILALYMFFGSINVYFNILLTYHGKASMVAGLTGITFLLNIIFNLMLIPKFGAAGSALAIILALFPISIIRFLITKKSFNV